MPSEDVYAVSADAADDAATGGNVAAERAPPLMSTDVFEQEPGNQIDNIVPTRGYGLTPTVGLGGSAGSIPALCTFFEAMPADSGLVFVVVLHLAPEHESTLAELLGRHTAMAVVQAEDGMSVEADHVYVIPPGKYLASVDGHLKLTPLEPERGRRMTVDVFFRTLADTHGAHAAAIVLSGADGDGAIGLKRIKERGGLTVAQDPNEAEHDGMPRSAIATNMVDWVLKARELPARLLEYFAREKQVKLPPEDGPQPATAPSASPGAEEASLREVLAFLRTRTDRDFSYYKRATVLRRISRRMQINGMAGLPEYLIFLRTHPGESGALLQDMLISVTNFFRDREAFTALETYVPLLFRGKKSGDTVRVWVTACASGEEAYSVAMLLSEHARRLSAPPNVQVFATDLAEEAVQSARNGVYPTNIATDVSEERLARFFTKEHLGYRVRRELRETVLFAQHDLLKDSPFSKLDLVTCRNLLIYLNRDAQERALAVFHFALLRQGLLFLGTSESVDETSEFFAPLDKKYRLYAARPAVKMGLPVPVGIGTLTRTIQDRGHAADGPVLPVATRPVAPPTGMPPWPQAERATGQAAASEAYLRILAEGGPASMIVSGQHDILHLSGAAGRFLQFGVGELTRDLWQAVHPMLRIELRAALTRASRTGQAARASGLSIELDGERQAVDIQVSPVWEDAASYFVITFGLRPAEPMDAVPAIPEIDPLAHQLEKELGQLKRHLRDVQESHEVTIEEHKAGNEELQAINEELRSASEELETSREELQAINEELNTVNAELKAHVDELAHANGDLHNLMAATNIATVFLDRELRITRYTPCAVTLFNFIPTDVGRPLTDLQHRLDYAELEEDARQVLARLAPVEREVHKHGNGWFLARLQPYRTVDDYIAGVVLTFVDITERRRADEALRESEERQVFLLGLSDALRSLDDPLNIQQVAMRMLGQRLDATRAFYFFTEPAEGGDWIHTIETDYRRDPGMPSHAGRHSVRDFGLGLFEGAEYGKVVAVEDVTRLSLLTASEVRKYLALEVVAFINVPLIRNGKFVAGIGAHDLAPRLWKPEEIALIQEVAARVGAAVERTRAEAALRESEERLQTMAENLPGGAVFIVNRDLRYLLANGEALRGAGLKPEDLVGKTVFDALSPELAADHEPYLRRALAGEHFTREHYSHGHAFVTRGTPLRGADGVTYAVLAVSYDITERKRAEEALRASEARMAADLADTQQLQRISSAFIEEDNIDALYEQILDAACAVMRADSASLQILAPGGTDLLLLAHRGFAPASARHWQKVQLDDPTSRGQAMSVTERIIVPDAEDSELLAGTEDLAYYRLSGIRAMQSTRLVSRGGHLVGMISTHWREPHHPSDRELRLFDVLARQAADLIERHTAGEALRESEARLRTAVALAELGTCRWDWSTHEIRGNDQRFLICGLDPAVGVIAEEQFRGMLHPGDREVAWPRILRDLEERGKYAAVYRLVRADGIVRWISQAGRVIDRLDGRPWHVESVFFDITSHREAEAAIAESELRFRTLTDAVPQVIWTNETDGKANYFNRRWFEYSGLDLEQSTGLGWQAIVHPDDAPASKEKWQHVLDAGEVFDTEYRLRGADGGYRWHLGRNVPLKDEAGRVLGWFGSATDIHDLKEAEQATERARAAVEAAGDAKDHFLAVLSHELRTPLMPITMALAVLAKREDLPDAVTKIFAMIKRNVELESRFIDDLLDVTRIERGKMEIARGDIDLYEAIERAVEVSTPDIEAKGQQLTVDLEGTACPFHGDFTRLQQAFWNLLKNASKFTPPSGVIMIRSRCRVGDPFIIEVTDTGIGLEADAIERIFLPFEQASVTITREFGGLGLGLAIAKATVDAHGGTLSVRSPGSGQGATFTVSLPS